MPFLLYNTEKPEFVSLEFNEVVVETARQGDLNRHLFILPTRRNVREVEREIIREHFRLTQRPIERSQIHTMDLFTQEFYRRLEPMKRDLTPEVALALVYRAMQKSDLDFYASNGRDPSPGVAERITRVISGVRADGIMPSDFKNDLDYLDGHPDEQGFNRRKISDLYEIYSNYLRLLNRFWSDHPGRMAWLNTELTRDRDATFRRAFPDLGSILVYGFREFTQPEIVLLQQLGFVTGLQVLIYLDYEEENGPLYGNFNDVVSKLSVAGYRMLDLDPLQPDIPEEERRPFSHHMRRNLFRTDQKIENSGFDGLISAFGFFNREEEVQGIASLVKSLVTDKRIAPERICIAAYSLQGYDLLFREHLATHGVPANITSSETLDQNGLMTALLAALAVPAGSYERRDVIRAVTSPYLSFGKKLDPAALVEASGRLRIRRGRNAWSRRIGQRIDYLRARLGSSSDPDESESMGNELGTLERAATSFEHLVATLDGFNHRMSPAEFRDEFRRLVGKLRTADNILGMRSELEGRQRTPQDWQRIHDEMERDTRALAACFRMLDAMTEFFDIEYGPTSPDIVAEPGRHGDGRYSLDFYIDQIRTASLRATYRLREKHDHGVLVTTTNAMQGLDFDAVILCGLIDGEFPNRYLPETFLGKPLPGAQDRQLRRERMEFYGAITSFNKELILTWPRHAGESVLVRSSFLDALLRITTVEESGRLVELDELRIVRDRARRGETLPGLVTPLTTIATAEALAEEAGAALWSGGEVPRIDDAEAMLTNLRHTRRVEEERQHGRTDSTAAEEYRGIITHALSDEELTVLAERREREYSPSQLELYARCPFKFFSRRVLHLVPASNYDVSLTPLERGLLLHSVLFRLYTEMREKGQLPLKRENRELAIERGRELAEEEIEGIFFDHPYWRLDQERLLGSGYLDGLIEGWIDSDIKRAESDRHSMEPEFFEVNFGGGRSGGGGMDGRLSTGETVRVHELNLRGRVDRVELHRRGDDLYYIVADYKTGAPPSRDDINEGLSLQLMLYLEVIRRLLSEHFNMPLEDVKPAGGVYYRLNTRKIAASMSAIFVPNEFKRDLVDSNKSKKDPDTIEDLEHIMATVMETARDYVEGIATGAFHTTTRDTKKVCIGCEFQMSCRVISN